MVEHPTTRVVVGKDIEWFFMKITSPFSTRRLDRYYFLFVGRITLFMTPKGFGNNAIGWASPVVICDESQPMQKPDISVVMINNLKNPVVVARGLSRESALNPKMQFLDL